MAIWPDRLFDLIYFPVMDDKLDELAALAEPESWDYQNTESTRHKPVLFNYIQYTYSKLVEENKIVLSDDGQAITFNTGLVTPNQEAIFAYATTNRNQGSTSPWFFNDWKRKGEHELTKFSDLPDMAHYFDDPSTLVFDPRKELRASIEHIVSDNKERFPEPYKSMDDYAVQTFLKGAIDNARERVRRNYKTAIPHYYRGRIQLMLPLCLGSPVNADLAIVAEDHGSFYRASTCLTLDMAYNNARQLARPDKDWLLP
ncbi:hypothetical protein THMIRHAM_10280 [Thiomicrorhabdus immobilis]|uniref:DUF3825 domain-containing protein n=1 Tax=Thiomicrorhabdus immobilis TaxID=2791037 RepID=A0ABM7MD09_9GAMM|nr:DUF3825 domain-containing protein [Thiomicrorhabdus immobilis]BCN93243.1 hypothetical protein THMIRHAM_10280 [Thiomicrorhabdus immobilis]